MEAQFLTGHAPVCPPPPDDNGIFHNGIGLSISLLIQSRGGSEVRHGATASLAGSTAAAYALVCTRPRVTALGSAEVGWVSPAPPLGRPAAGG